MVVCHTKFLGHSARLSDVVLVAKGFIRYTILVFVVFSEYDLIEETAIYDHEF